MESDDDDECWDEVMDDPDVVNCVFCSAVFQTTVALWEHCVEIHQFDITQFKRKAGLNFYDYIKLVNFLRKERPTSEVVLESKPPYPWEKDQFLQPVIQDDPLLQYDIEGSDSEEDMNGEETEQQNGTCCYNGESIYENGDIKEKLKAAEERTRIAESALCQALADLESMRAGVHSLVLGVKDAGNEPGTSASCGESLDLEDEDSYFSSYSHYSIHEEMLKDKVRTMSYKDFIHKNNALFEGKVILDIGCGSGILSIFAAQAGAKKVIGIDKSSIIYHAMDIVRENKFDNIISLMKGKVEESNLGVKKVDIIISEWMGYFLLFESMLDTVLFARDKWLAENGKVYPDKCTMSVVGLRDDKRRLEKLTFWEDVYGVKMSCMKNLVLSEPIVDIVDPNTIMTGSCIVKELNVNTVKIEELDFKSSFELEAITDGNLNIIVGYFDIFFEDCTNKISFSTHPKCTSTHWKQTVFQLENLLPLKKGEVVQGSIQCKKNKKDFRSLDIVLEIRHKDSKDVIINKYTLQ